MNYYTTPSKVRRKLGITEDEVPDDDIYAYIEDAQKDMIRDISYDVKNEVITLDSSGLTISTKFPNIADRNFDSLANSLDVTVYGWTVENDPSTKTTLAVSTVYDREGKIILAANGSSYAKVSVDYRYYNKAVDYELFPEACALLAAYYYANAEIVIMPNQWMHGAYRFQKTQDIDRLVPLYWNKIYAIRGVAHEVVEGEDAKLERGNN